MEQEQKTSMTSQITLLITSLAEHFVVYFHGVGMPVAFLVSVLIQLAWAAWGIQIGDPLFVTTGLTLAFLNAYFHFRKSKKETKVFSPKIKVGETYYASYGSSFVKAVVLEERRGFFWKKQYKCLCVFKDKSSGVCTLESKNFVDTRINKEIDSFSLFKN